MPISIESSLGWLADLFGLHVYRDDVPETMRRRWSFDGLGWTLTDDDVNEVMRLTFSGDFSDVPAEFDEASIVAATIEDLTVTEVLQVDAGGNTRLHVNSEGVTVGAALPIVGQRGALWLDDLALFPNVAPPDGVFVFSWASELFTMGPAGTATRAHLSGVQYSDGALNLDGADGIEFSKNGGEVLASLDDNLSGAVVLTPASDRPGFGFEASDPSQYMYFRAGSSGSVYFDSPTLNWRSADALTEYIRCEVSGATRIIGIPARTSNGTGANLRLRPQPVNTGRGGIDSPGSLDIDLGQCIATGAEESGRVNFRDQLGVAAYMVFGGTGGEAATAGFSLIGNPVGTDGRARNVALNVNSPGGVAFGVGTSNVDITLDATQIKARYSSVTLMQATANGQSLGGDVEAAQNGSLRLAHTGVPSAAPTAGAYLWNDSGQLRSRSQYNVISEVSTGKRSAIYTPTGPTRCFDRQDTREVSGAATTDMNLITSTELPFGGAGGNWTMRVWVEWSAYDTDGDLVMGGTRKALLASSGGTRIVTSAANQVVGTDDDEAVGAVLSTGAALFLRLNAGDLQIRFVTVGGVVTYVHAHIIATLWEH